MNDFSLVLHSKVSFSICLSRKRGASRLITMVKFFRSIFISMVDSFLFTENRCDFRSRKFFNFISEPIGEKRLDQIPGIGSQTFHRFQKTIRMSKAKQLLDELIERFQFDHRLFRLWLIEDFHLPEYRATECAVALLEYVDRAKKINWPL